MDNLELRKKYFTFVRDIPYRIYLTPYEPDYCCTGKHWLLKQLLESSGLKTRYKVCKFLWKENFEFPEEVKNKKHNDFCTHTYLEVFIPETEKWSVVDATNDIGLKSKFKINKWDGINETEIWCKPTKTYSVEESEEKVKKYNIKEEKEEDLKVHKEFYKAINEWFESIRGK